MRKKLLIAVPVLVLLVAGVGYEAVLKPAPKKVVPKIDGTLVALGDPFTINLAGGHYARISVSLLVSSAPAPQPTDSGGTAVVLPENDALRAIVTDELTGLASDRLIDRSARTAVLAHLLHALKTQTDEPIKQVLFTDIAIE